MHTIVSAYLTNLHVCLVAACRNLCRRYVGLVLVSFKFQYSGCTLQGTPFVCCPRKREACLLSIHPPTDNSFSVDDILVALGTTTVLAIVWRNALLFSFLFSGQNLCSRSSRACCVLVRPQPRATLDDASHLHDRHATPPPAVQTKHEYTPPPRRLPLCPEPRVNRNERSSSLCTTGY